MKLLIDGVVLPWPRKIEIQVDSAGETVGPLRLECSGGQLIILGSAEQESAILTILPDWALPGGSPRERAFFVLEQHGWRFDELPMPDVIEERER